MKIIDLFCGCGGFTLGAYQAGFISSLALDKDRDLLSAYKRNFQLGLARQRDIDTVTARSLLNLSKDLRPIGVIGGPPCQGFSVIGRQCAGDERNTLVGKFLSLAVSLRPAFFVMENVPGILAKQHRVALELALENITPPYDFVGPIILNAADYGAATNRKRVLIIGFDRNRMHSITEADLLEAQISARPISVSEAIRDLPSPGPPDRKSNGYGWYKTPKAVRLTEYAKKMRAPPPDCMLPLYARGLYEGGFITGLESTVHTPKIIERFAGTEPGKEEKVSRYYRLSWDRPAPTLRAGTGPDRGSYQAARPIHPDEPRVITVREAARLQGFPDWFLFHPAKWHSHRMIGNSVSPIFAEAIMKVIASKLDSFENQSKNVFSFNGPIDTRTALAVDVSSAKQGHVS